jgi:hypothetical protein
MSVSHNHPHPKFGQVVTPSNVEIAKKYGRVHIIDWDDRVSGLTISEQNGRGGYPQAEKYTAYATMEKVSPLSSSLDIVRCYTVGTGELVLLHNDWLS